MNTFQQKIIDSLNIQPLTELDLLMQLGYAGRRGLETAAHVAVQELLRKRMIKEQHGVLLV